MRPPDGRTAGYTRSMGQREFVLQRVQPALVGLIDGSMSTLAPIFAVAIATHVPRYAFLAGVATDLIVTYGGA